MYGPYVARVVGMNEIKTHELKLWPGHFVAVASGAKTHEIRRNDRGFHAADTLHLREWDPVTRRYTGRSITRTVTHITTDVDGLEPGYVILSLAGDHDR